MLQGGWEHARQHITQSTMTKHTLVLFMGVLFKKASLLLLNREYFWQPFDSYGIHTQIGKFGSKNVLKKTLECFKLPKDNKGLDYIWGDC